MTLAQPRTTPLFQSYADGPATVSCQLVVPGSSLLFLSSQLQPTRLRNEMEYRNLATNTTENMVFHPGELSHLASL